MKQAFWFLCAIIVSTFASGALVSAEAQVSSPTPDPFIVQLTKTPTISFSTLDGDMSADGRFVVFVSNANVATENPRNADGNFEIFLADYAQRRIFQITNTKSVVQTPSASPTPTPSPSPSPTVSPSPTPSPVPTPENLTLVKIQIVNKEPMISLSPELVGGQRVYTIVFSSNAPATPNPGNFDGTEGTLADDANTEIWIYRVPAVTDVNLTLGADLPFQDLAAGTFTQITNSPAFRKPTAGSSSVAPFFSDDNREPTINDDGRFLAFTSTRNLVPGVGNADFSPEIFFYNFQSASLVQGTNVVASPNDAIQLFMANPTLSADGTTVSFFSNANIATSNPLNTDRNGEVYVGTFGGSSMTSIKQVTRTQISPTLPTTTNLFSPGRRLSRNGAFIALESIATDPKANSTTNGNALGLFVYNVSADTFVEVGPRPTVFQDFAHVPVFTDYQAGTLAPSSLAYVSNQNFRADGTVPAAAQAAEGLNPNGAPQLFLTQIPASTTNTFVRVTNNPLPALAITPRPMASASHKRMTINMGGFDLGTGNADGSIELFYLLTPIVTAQDPAVLTFSTDGSNMPVATATPVPSPSPSPTPTPSPAPGVALGLAPGELSRIKSTVSLAPASTQAVCLDGTTSCLNETNRSPALPVELNGVSVSVNGAAAGLHFVGNAEKEIKFVVPITMPSGLGTVAVNILNAGANTDTLLRGFVPIVVAQPDIFSSTGDALGNAIAFNVTNPGLRLPPPFNVTTDVNGTAVPTQVELSVTGLRLALKAEVTVTIGTPTPTVITGDGIVSIQPNPNMPGQDLLIFTLPASLAGAGEVPIIVSFARTGIATTSRPADTAPKIRIN